MGASPVVKDGNQPGGNGIPGILDTQSQGQLCGCVVFESHSAHVQKGCKLGLMLYYCFHLEILNHFLSKGSCTRPLKWYSQSCLKQATA